MGITDDDRDAFAAATQDVQPLRPTGQIAPTKRAPRAIAKQTRAATEEMLAESMTDSRGGSLAEEIGFRRRSVTERTFRALQRGRFSIEDEIDLHGLRQEPAKRALQAFITECAARHLGCVRVVHGKGSRSGPDGPVLKASVQQWLTQWDAVLAFASAIPRHGGTGAIYVLLRNN